MAALATVVDEVRERTVPDRPPSAGRRRDADLPHQGLQALAACGADGLLVPGEHGGAGGSLEALADACEAVGARRGSASRGRAEILSSGLWLAMGAADSDICDAMRLGNQSRWIEADESGYADLVEAVRWRSG